jgi:hypothetical protein
MLKKRMYKNTIQLREPNDPISQRKMYVKEILKDSTFFPKTVKYRDIDEAFVKWVEDELKISFEEEILPTFALFSNQRYTEYMQMWKSVDDNNNIKMNFKVVTRENNPKEGTIYNKKSNVPRKVNFLMNQIEALNDEGKLCTVQYTMTQPMAMDLNYKLTLVTNKYELLNEFNMMLNDKFTTLHAYLYPNGHPMSMKLKNISDESEYNANDRQYFAQTYDISVLGYIITEKDFDIEIKPIVTLQCIGDESLRKKPRVEIEEFEIMNSCEEEKPSRYYQQPTRITIAYDERESLNSEFTIDCDMNITKIYGENIRTYHIKVNDEVVEMVDGSIKVKENDVIAIKVKKINSMKGAVLYLEGVNPDNVYDSRKDLMESQLDEKNISQEIIIQ